MKTRKIAPVALSITLVSLLATMAGCAHEAPGAVTPAMASHPVVDYAVPVEASRSVERSARFEVATPVPTRMAMRSLAKR